jgi:hypothetical protein
VDVDRTLGHGASRLARGGQHLDNVRQTWQKRSGLAAIEQEFLSSVNYERIGYLVLLSVPGKCSSLSRSILPLLYYPRRNHISRSSIEDRV